MKDIVEKRIGLVMNKEEKQLRSTRDQLLAELKECNDRLDAIKAQRDKEAEIKRTYQPNQVEPEYEVDWKGYATTLEAAIEKASHSISNQKDIQKFLKQAKLANSSKVLVDPAKIWNCPKCGESDVLYIGNYGTDEFHMEYAVTCSNCDFVGPTISDYGEVWCEFEDWLRKKGYLKDEN